MLINLFCIIKSFFLKISIMERCKADQDLMVLVKNMMVKYQMINL